MKKNITPKNGPLKDSDGHSVSELLAALTTSQYQHLARFARWRLHAVSSSRRLRQCLAVVDPEDLVNEALVKVLLGDDNPALGRHLKRSHLASLDKFLVAVKGMISSDLSNLISGARGRSEHLALGDPDEIPGTVDLAIPEDLHQSLLRRDLHKVLFAELYERIRHQPALLGVVQSWERRFFDDDRIGSLGQNPALIHRVRRLVREILVELESEFSSVPGDGREMLL